MRIKLSIYGLVYLLCVISACAQSHSNQTAKQAPHIKFDLEEYNFGKVNEGTLVKHIFRFKNIGGDTLRIKRINPG
jgi:hypothetical protein